MAEVSADFPSRGHAVTTIYYLGHRIDPRQAMEKLVHLMSVISVAPINDLVIQQALASPIADFEDAVTHAAAEACKADVIVTRSLNDFKKAVIPVTSPALFLKSRWQQRGEIRPD